MAYVANQPPIKTAQALEFFTRAAQIQPGQAEYQVLLAQAQWKLGGSPGSAINTLRRATLISDDPFVPLLLTRIQVEEGRMQDAGFTLTPLLAVGAYLPGVGYLEGRIAESQGKPEQAEQAYLRDLQASQSRGVLEGKSDMKHINLPDLYLRLASVKESLGKYDQAVAYYHKHLATLEGRDVNIPLGYLRLARLYRDRLQDYPSAEKVLTQALDIARQANPAEVENVRKEILELKRTMRLLREKEAAQDLPVPETTEQ
jgi:tetratricopeptide (TPR) repeat protein